MKRNEFGALKSQDIKGLVESLKKAKKEMADLVLDKNMKKLKDIKAVSKKRKDIAQMMTLIRQKELLAQLEPKELKV